jgi:hypothetical protein
MKDNRPPSPSPDKVHKLDGVTRSKLGHVQLGSTHDPAVQLDHNRSRIKPQLTEQVGRSRRSLDPPGFAIHHDIDLVHAVMAQ